MVSGFQNILKNTLSQVPRFVHDFSGQFEKSASILTISGSGQIFYVPFFVRLTFFVWSLFNFFMKFRENFWRIFLLWMKFNFLLKIFSLSFQLGRSHKTKTNLPKNTPNLYPNLGINVEKIHVSKCKRKTFFVTVGRKLTQKLCYYTKIADLISHKSSCFTFWINMARKKYIFFYIPDFDQLIKITHYDSSSFPVLYFKRVSLDSWLGHEIVPYEIISFERVILHTIRLHITGVTYQYKCYIGVKWHLILVSLDSVSAI